VQYGSLRQTWSLYIEDAPGDFLDSFGRRPNADFERYMNCHCESWNFNDKQLQSIVSKFCGYYCVYFCILHSKGLDMRRIMRSFSSDTGLNDASVHAYVWRRQQNTMFSKNVCYSTHTHKKQHVFSENVFLFHTQ